MTSPLRLAYWKWQVARKAAKAQRHTDRRRHAAAKTLTKFAPPYKLHVGCGRVHFDGWINLDGDQEYANPDIIWDLRDGLPVPDASCRYIHSEHVVEHIPVASGVNFFRECRRTLVPGGVMRVAMPSLDNILKLVAAGRWQDQDWLRWPDFQFVQTQCEMLNMSFRAWEHQWLYDREELERRLKEAGFTAIAFRNHSESDEPELRNRETRADSLLIAEVTKL
ncbi:hypothetical protein BH11PLA2_BH11PLA2_13390 [soil metagenome]